MQLYSASASPFARKVLVTLHETAQFDDVEVVAASGSPLDASGMPTAHNPLGKLPALTRPDGPRDLRQSSDLPLSGSPRQSRAVSRAHPVGNPDA